MARPSSLPDDAAPSVPMSKGTACACAAAIAAALAVAIALVQPIDNMSFVEVSETKQQTHGHRLYALTALRDLRVEDGENDFPPLPYASNVDAAYCLAACEHLASCAAFSHDSLRRDCFLVDVSRIGHVKVLRAAWHQTGIILNRAWNSTIADAAVAASPWPRQSTWRPALSARERRATFTIQARYTSMRGGELRRTDYDGAVRSALMDIGMVQLPEHRLDADLIWGLQWESLADFRRARLNASQIVNMMPGMAKLTLGDKDALHFSTNRARAAGRSSRILESYMLPEEATAWHSRAADGDGSAWVWKELNTWSGAGVRVMTAAQISRELASADTPSRAVIQRYVNNPMTLLGYKFDMRWWALVTSIDPLRAYMLPDAYLKVARSQKYDPSPQHFHNRCIHVTNNKVQSGCSGAETTPEIFRPA